MSSSDMDREHALNDVTERVYIFFLREMEKRGFTRENDMRYFMLGAAGRLIEGAEISIRKDLVAADFEEAMKQADTTSSKSSRKKK